ncbi:hypothetical protein AC578_2467 [Pseudocercospora eumusae]|uniref:Uncharacterized protein n=1 Tax=Pseudocercospora eumusae TaxID=321146 RepID=A0A139HXA4_9PEZI|nr:hypothetical protein AC578_2467 [Pseudocercospora eumusae]
MVGHMPEPAGWSNHPQFDVDDWSDNQQSKNKNGKNKNDKNSSVETSYEGFYLERAEPLAGERRSWARVGRRAMPFDDAKLAEMSRKHRALTKIGPAKAFSALNSSQQGVVGRLIADHQANEKNKDAEWVLDYVKPTIEKDYWRRVTRCTKIAVIIRRQQRNGPLKDSQGYAKGTATYAAGEIIDLLDPLPKKKEEKGDKKGMKKNNKHQDIHDIDHIIGDGPISDPFASLGRDPIVDVPPHVPHQGGRHGNQQPPPMQPFGPPPGAIPVGAPLPPPLFPPHEQHPRPHSGHGANPFQPHREFDTPDLYEEHRGFAPDLGRNPRLQARTPVHMDDEGRRSRSRARSASRRRDDKFRRQQEMEDQREEDRQQREEDRRQQRANQRRIETKMDELGARFEELELQSPQNKVNAWHSRDSSSEESYRRGRRDRREFWGHDNDTRASFTPPSSPGRSEIYPSGSLGGRRVSKEDRDFRGYPQERRRSAGYRDAQAFIEPHNSNSRRNLRRQIDWPPRAPSPGRYMRRPPLIHAATFDDYPREPVAQRLLPEFENQEFPRAQFGVGRDRDRRRGERMTRRNTVDYGRPYRNDDEFVERGGMRRDRIFR